jgi:hypothetical protein
MPDHSGIVVCTFDPNFEALANRVHQIITTTPDVGGKLLRVNRPQK